MSGQPVCPQCNAPVEAHWDWCYACGFDPAGKRAEAEAAKVDALAGTTGALVPAPPRVPPPPVEPVPTPFLSTPSFTPPSPSWDNPAPAWDHDTAEAPRGIEAAAPTRTAGSSPLSALSALTPRRALIGAVCLLALVLLVAVIVNMASNSPSGHASVASTVDPNAPPPLGEVPLTPNTGGSGTKSSVTPSTFAKPTDGWQTYKAPDTTFQIDFPGRPEVRSDQSTERGKALGALELTFPVGTEGAGYRLVYSDLAQGGLYADSQALFDEFSAGEETLIQTGTYDFGGVVGIQYSDESGGRKLTGILTLKGSRFYDATVIDVGPNEFVRFVTSLHFLTDPPKK
jgi:hypothetical protein